VLNEDIELKLKPEQCVLFLHVKVFYDITSVITEFYLCLTCIVCILV